MIEIDTFLPTTTPHFFSVEVDLLAGKTVHLIIQPDRGASATPTPVGLQATVSRIAPAAEKIWLYACSPQISKAPNPLTIAVPAT